MCRLVCHALLCAVYLCTPKICRLLVYTLYARTSKAKRCIHSIDLLYEVGSQKQELIRYRMFLICWPKGMGNFGEISKLPKNLLKLLSSFKPLWRTIYIETEEQWLPKRVHENPHAFGHKKQSKFRIDRVKQNFVDKYVLFLWFLSPIVNLQCLTNKNIFSAIKRVFPPSFCFNFIPISIPTTFSEKIPRTILRKT